MAATGLSLARGGLLAAVGMAAAAPAAAIDWRGAIGVSQRLDLGDGLGSGDGNDGAALDSITGLTVNLIGRTPRSTFTFAPGMSVFLSTDSDFDIRSVRPTFRGSVSTGSATTRFDTVLSFVPRFVDFDRTVQDALDDPFLPGADPTTGEPPEETTSARSTANALELDTSFSMGVSHAIDARNSLNSGFFVRRRDYTETDAGFAPSTSFGIGAGWSRRLSVLSSGSLSANARQFLSDDSSRESTRSYGLSAGLSTRMTPNLSVNGSLGFVLTEREGEGVEPGFTGRFGLGYRMTRFTRLSVGLSQSVEQDRDGQVQNVLAARAGITTELSGRSTIGVGARVGSEVPVFDDTDDDRITFTLSPTYSYRLTENWRVSASYALRYESDDGSDDLSNTVSIRIGRSFDLF